MPMKDKFSIKTKTFESKAKFEFDKLWYNSIVCTMLHVDIFVRGVNAATSGGPLSTLKNNFF